MTITPTTLFRASGVAASLAGLIFVGVQINHPHMDVTSITTTDVIARDLLKLLMAAMALVVMLRTHSFDSLRSKIEERLPKIAERIPEMIEEALE